MDHKEINKLIEKVTHSFSIQCLNDLTFCRNMKLFQKSLIETIDSKFTPRVFNGELLSTGLKSELFKN